MNESEERKAIAAKQSAEPVAWVDGHALAWLCGGSMASVNAYPAKTDEDQVPLYATPPSPTAVEAPSLREALAELVAKMTAIEADPNYQGIWSFLLVHGIEWKGPSWHEELESAKRALASPKAGARPDPSVVAWCFMAKDGPQFVWGARPHELSILDEEHRARLFPLHDTPLFDGQQPFARRVGGPSVVGFFPMRAEDLTHIDPAYIGPPLFAEFPFWPASPTAGEAREQSSRQMFVARLHNAPYDQPITTGDVLALLDDCDFLASRESGEARDAPDLEALAKVLCAKYWEKGRYDSSPDWLAIADAAIAALTGDSKP